MVERYVETAEAMEALGRELAPCLRGLRLVCLHGELGAGKTTLVRGLLRGYGYRGAVKSPTFTLAEPYALDRFTLIHFDFYRLKEPEETEFMGLRDYLREDNLCIVEWPERVRGVLPDSDVDVKIEKEAGGRRVRILARGRKAEAALEQLA